MTSGFEITRTILTSCQALSVHHFSTVPQSQITLPCRSRSANQTSTECCLEVTALTRLSNVSWAVSSPCQGFPRPPPPGVLGGRDCPGPYVPLSNALDGGAPARGSAAAGGPRAASSRRHSTGACTRTSGRPRTSRGRCTRDRPASPRRTPGTPARHRPWPSWRRAGGSGRPHR